MDLDIFGLHISLPIKSHPYAGLIFETSDFSKQGNSMKTVFWVLTLIAISANSIFADGWIPTPSSGLKGYLVKLVVYDMRNPQYHQLQVLLENNISYFYVFNSQDQLQVSRANAIYATFMTAKSSGEVVSIHATSANPPLITAAQLGPNP